MFSRRERLAAAPHTEEEQLEDDLHHKHITGTSERDTKRGLVVAIAFCLLVLCWLGMQPTPPAPPSIYVWTEQNTKYPKLESNFPPSEEAIVLPRLSSDPTLMKLLDKEWTAAMTSSPIVGIDFEFNKGFSDKYRVVFESGHVAVVRLCLIALMFHLSV